MSNKSMKLAAARAKAPATRGAPTAGRKPAIAPGVIPHWDEAVATDMARNASSRERYQFLLRTLFVLLALLGVSIFGNVYLGLQDTKYRYFSTDPDGNIRELDPQQKPIQSSGEVLNWVSSAVTRAFTLSFANHRQELAAVRNDFTGAGWRGFDEALATRGLLDAIVNNKYVSTAAPTAAPVIVAQGFVGESYGWKIELPMIITYESASSRTSQSLLVEVTVVRRPPQEHPRGLGIAQIIAK